VFNTLITDFKEAKPEFSRVRVSVESFADRAIYYDTIVAAI
jgi:hypothetical protein